MKGKNIQIILATFAIAAITVVGSMSSMNKKGFVSSSLHSDSVPVITLTAEEDIADAQDGDFFSTKIRYNNTSDITFAPGTLTTTIVSQGETLESFTNSSVLEFDDSILTSVSVPNLAGHEYSVTCSSEVYTVLCGDFSFTIPAQAKVPVPTAEPIAVRDIDFEEPTDVLPVIDWKAVKITNTLVTTEGEEKIKVGISLLPVADTAFDSNVVVDIRIPEDNFMLASESGFRTFEPDTSYTHFLYLPPSKKGKLIEAHVAVKGFDDPNETNNTTSHTLSTFDESSDNELDIKITDVNTKITEHNGEIMIKLYIALQMVGDESVQMDDLGLRITYPFSNEEQLFESVYGGVIEPESEFGFTTYVPLSKQKHAVTLTLDPKFKYDDSDRTNNTLETTLPSIGSESYVNFKLFNTSTKTVRQDDVEMIKLYFEFSHDGDSAFTHPLPAMISLVETGEVIQKIDNLAINEPLVPGATYAWTSFLSLEKYAGKIVKVALHAPADSIDPFMADNRGYIRLAEPKSAE